VTSWSCDELTGSPIKAIQKEEVKLRGKISESSFEAGSNRERELWMSRMVNQTRKK